MRLRRQSCGWTGRGDNGTILLTEQGIERNGEVLDHGLIVAETPDRQRASFIISAPCVRSRKPEFIGFGESLDRGFSVAKGDRIVLKVTKLDFYCSDVPTLLNRFMQVRKWYNTGEDIRHLIPMSEVFSIMSKNIDRRYYEDGKSLLPSGKCRLDVLWLDRRPDQYLSDVGDRRCGTLQKVKSTFDFALPSAKWKKWLLLQNVVRADKEVVRRDACAHIPQIGLTRRNADILYWMVKQFDLLKKQGKGSEISSAWESDVRKLADAFKSTWRNYGTWGNYVNVETGEVAAYNTTGGQWPLEAWLWLRSIIGSPLIFRSPARRPKFIMTVLLWLVLLPEVVEIFCKTRIRRQPLRL